jgi:Regulator of chromosome condensation (RCC1) repeat
MPAVAADLDRLKPRAQVRFPGHPHAVTLVAVTPGPFWEFFFEGPSGTGKQVLAEAELATIELVESLDEVHFEADPEHFRLGVEARRIDIAFAYDMAAVAVSNIQPFPHQLEAVYDCFLREPRLRYLLADDPGAGKTTMAGLYMKELILRRAGDRILVVTPANLRPQWIRELAVRALWVGFKLEIRDAMIESASGASAQVLRSSGGTSARTAASSVFTRVSAGMGSVCGLEKTGKVVCWGWDSEGQSDAPSGTFSLVSAGAGFACGLKSGGTVVCWGDAVDGVIDVPSGTYTQISAGGGAGDFHVGTPPYAFGLWGFACGVQTGGKLVCWGGNSDVGTQVPAGHFTQVSAGTGYSCALRKSGKVVCWGVNTDPTNGYVPAGTYKQVSVSRFGPGYPATACAIRTNGTVACWGDGTPKPVPAGRFKNVSAGLQPACGVKHTASSSAGDATTPVSVQCRRGHLPRSRQAAVSTGTTMPAR